MMILQAVSENRSLLNEIADDLLKVKLLASAMVSDAVIFKTANEQGTIITSSQFILKGISKSLLFSTINNRLRGMYGDTMPLLYSEPIIMLDPLQTEEILEKLAPV